MAGTSNLRASNLQAPTALSARSSRDVVRPLARAVERPCSRPGCGTPARATMTFRYGTREAWIERLADTPPPQSYDLCQVHAARTSTPHGWQLRDRRSDDERQVQSTPATPDDLGGDRTVAVLAAALRAVPDAVSEDAVPDPAPEVARAVAPEPAPLDPPAASAAPGPAAGPAAGPAPAPRAAPRPVLAVREPRPAAEW